MTQRRTNVILLALAVVVFCIALAVGAPKGEFGGADATATEQIEERHPDYKPWFSSVWEQPGGEVESGLFALQAGIGGGVLGFALGHYRARRKDKATSSDERAEVAAADQPGS